MAVASPTQSTSGHDDEFQEDSIRLLPMDETPEDTLYIRRPRGVFYVLVLSSGFGTLQLVFALLASYGSAQLLSVGVSQAATGLTWLAGPLAGTFVQPMVGIISDRYGHQKLIVSAGFIGLVMSLLGLGWAPDLTLDGGQRNGLSRALVVFFIFTLNVAIQPVQLGLRVMMIENCRPEQQTMVSAWAARMTGIGNIVAQLAGSMDTTKLQPFMTGSHFKNLCLFTSFCLVFSVITLSVFLTDGAAPRSKFEKPNHQKTTLMGLWKVIRSLSPEVISVWKIQLFSWMGWFPFLYYVTTYIDYLAFHDLLQNAAAADEEQQQILKNESLQFGSRAMLLNACVAFISSILLPWLFKRYDGTQSKFRNYATLSNLWMTSQVLFGIGMICTLWVSTVVGATLLISVLGLSWYCTGWIPFALISTKVSQESARFSRSHGPGLIMSLHNVSIAAPQILMALIVGFTFWVSSDGENQARYVLAVGGVFGLAAAWMVRGLHIEKDLQ
ncbi:major facilitator superfamily domain-containing protein [Talaromyces proteolyticus]|uniref:Major facilitator superfamily domain-containing protein n=1 Tax=Talaromyces proteolyticus TaxID=1131652 RepID=A0AAD4PV08_9EURO|nr:major facilitator superfamily domain-containing protein [Talaromyces proteolyticus]KAH8690071.1 major facilitator superfamily domain-containing protein [Talaromyces proteolyticus]